MELRTFIDQLGNEITISFPPQRIISLVPSQTELLADLGLNDSVVGITKFCIHPETWVKTKTIVGGTKKFDFDKIKSLQPDLIIGNKEENYQEGIERLQAAYPVWMSDIITKADALAMIQQLGELADVQKQADNIIGQINKAFLGLEKLPPLRTLYLIWRNPWMAAASGTFIHELITLAGFKNCLDVKDRYPELSDQDIKSLDPELILLSSEPYPFQQKNIDEIRRIVPKAKVFLVDGEMFSWYGSRLILFPNYIKQIRSSLS
jgi:ABC-type Fe3+-hydroxamate transport system substrate-binding protein